ncbi:MAG: hypothetical protein JST28_01800 [Acidobacteria bacterium]|nr:hypothetical protein [Acidobacteriota bacterium]
MPLFVRMQVLEAKDGSFEAIDDGEVIRTCLLNFNEDKLQALKALQAANITATDYEPVEF